MRRRSDERLFGGLPRRLRHVAADRTARLRALDRRDVGGQLLLLRFPVVDVDRFFRRTMLLAGLAFAAFVGLPWLSLQLVALSVLGACTAGWYPLLQARLYDEEPEEPGIVVAAMSIFGLVVAWIPLLIGVVAENVGLVIAMWGLVPAPFAMFFLFRRSPDGERDENGPVE